MAVALRKESVDRNTAAVSEQQVQVVALRKESVDRNPDEVLRFCKDRCRSPQGERG